MDSKYTTCRTSENDLSPHSFFSPKRATFKYVGLALTCFLCVGLYFCYDNPGALQDKFEVDLKLHARQFVLLYSIYSWPNVVLCLVGGFLLDRVFGIRWGTIIYATLTLCGQLLFAMGTYMDIFWLMIVGRFIFGTGSESLIIAQTSYAVLWCDSRKLNTLLALQWSLSQLGSTLNSLTIGNIYELVSDSFMSTGPKSIGIVLFIASLTCLGSLICAFVLGYMDKIAEKVLNRKKDKNPESIQLTDVKDFKINFWFVVISFSAYRVAIYPFMSFGKLFFMEKYGLESDAANTVISQFYSVSVIAFPLFGLFIDKIGRNILWVVISIIGSLLCHGLIAFTYTNPHFCTVFLGICYSLFTASLWPMIAFMTPESQLGTAYGITQTILNLNQAVMSIFCGIIIDNYGYFMLELFFLVWLLISLAPAIMICILNSNSNSKISHAVEKSIPNSHLGEEVLHKSQISCVIKKSVSRELMQSVDKSREKL